MKTLDYSDGLHRLNSCKAWYKVDKERYDTMDGGCCSFVSFVFTSFYTDMFDIERETFYDSKGYAKNETMTIIVRENPRCSATTSQHVHKFFNAFMPMASYAEKQELIDAMYHVWRYRRQDAKCSFRYDGRFIEVISW